MKFFLLFCFLTLFFNPSYAFDSKCYKALSSGEYYKLKIFILYLADSKIDNTAKFLKHKEEALLPEGMPKDPFLAYPSLRNNWNNLWRRVKKVRLQKEREQKALALVTANKNITIKEIADKTKFTIDQVYDIIEQLIKTKQMAYKSLKDFILFMVNAEIDTTTKQFLQQRNKGLLPADVPYKPLKVYRRLKKNWHNLQQRIEKIRIQKERENQALALIAENKNIIAKEIADATGFTTHIVYYIIEQLKKEGHLVRIGEKWEIPEEGDKPFLDRMEERKKQILDLVAENKSITVKELAAETGLTIDSVYYSIEQLIKEKQLAYKSIQDFTLILADSEIDSTEKFLKQKEEGLFSVDVPHKPLQIYSVLQRSWDNLWERVKQIQIQNEIQNQALALVAENKNITVKEIADLTELAIDNVYSIIEQLIKEKQLAYKSIRVFFLFLISSKINNTEAFLKQRDSGLLPVGIPDKPLQAYPTLRGSWESLWKRVDKTRIQKEREQQVLDIIEETDTITAVEIAAKTGLSIQKIYYTIKLLQEAEQLIYIGTPSSGRWEILEKGQKPSPNPMEERKKQILTLIEENDTIMPAEIAAKTGISIQKIYYTIAQLRKEERLNYIGFSPYGRWEILKKGQKPSPVLMEERKKRVLALIAKNKKISLKSLADTMEVSITVIHRITKKLREDKKLERVGLESGYWKILEKGVETLIEFLTESFPNSIKAQIKQVLHLILIHETISIEQIAQMTGLSKKAIQEITELKWEILREGAEPLTISIAELLTESPATALDENLTASPATALDENLTASPVTALDETPTEAPATALDELLIEPSVQPSIESLDESDPEIIEEHKMEVLVLIFTRENISVEEIASIRNVSNKVVQEIIKKLRWQFQDKLKKTKEQILTLITEDKKIPIFKIAETIKTPILLTRKLIEQLRREKILFGEEEDWIIPEGNPAY